MKPSFALNITDDAIGLLHRTARGWLDVGEVRLDRSDLGDALGYLRSSAVALAPRGFTTKLVIPNSQILYDEVAAPGPDSASRRKQIRAALEGRTPYAVEDLVFDWWGTGPTVQVAVVARETLVEAEAFAEQHRLNPLSFVAIPPVGKFGAEPWFGPAAGADKHLPAGQKVERDQDPIVIVARDAARAAPEAKAAMVDATAEAADAPDVAETDSAPEVPVDTITEVPVEATVTPAEATLPTPAVQITPDPLPEADAQIDPQTDRSGRKSRRASRQAEATAEGDVPPAGGTVTEAPILDKPPVQDAAPAADSPADAPPAGMADTDPAPIAADLPDNAATSPAPTPATGRDDQPTTVPAEPASEPLAARGADTGPDRTTPAFAPVPATALPAFKGSDLIAPFVTAPDFGPEPADSAAPEAEDMTAPPLRVAEATTAAASGFASRRQTDDGTARRSVTAPQVAPLSAQKTRPGLRAVPDPSPARPMAPRPSVPPKLSYGDERMAAVPPRPEPLRNSGGGAAPALAGNRAAKVVPPPRPAKPLPQGGKTATAGLGGLGSKAAVRGKPRYLGLILTGLLLLFLAAIAAWSSYYIASNRGEDATAVAGLAGDDLSFAAPNPVAPDAVATDPVTSDPVTTESPADVPAIADEMAADMEAPTGATDLQPMAEAEPVAEPAPEVPAAPAATPGPAPIAGDAATALATAATAPQPGSEVQDEIFLAAMDAAPPVIDPVALPLPASVADAPPLPQMPPPPFGTVYQFDAAGRITPTAEGVITPEGVTLVAGRPAIVPPARPAPLPGAAPVAPDAATGNAPDQSGAVLTPAADPAAPDTRLAAARPLPRPLLPVLADLTAARDAAVIEAAMDPRLAAVRPPSRPGGPVTVAAAQPADQPTAVDDATGAARIAPLPRPETLASAAPAIDPTTISPLAVTVSLRPAARPAGLAIAAAPDNSAADAAVEAALAAPAQSDTAEPEADAEPEVASAAPRIPTRASVAKQATFTNVLNMRELNLIGVFGTSANRYAMVRNAGGRFSKVRVGDRLDGGTVAEITSTELRYSKGGRLVSLSMPRG